MSHRLIDLELTLPLSPIDLGADEEGIGLVLRRRGRVVGFTLVDRLRGGRIEAVDLAHLAAEAAGRSLLAATVREELEVRESGELSPLSLTFAICTRDRPERLVRCLDGLSAMIASGALPDDRIETLVVDTAPTDDRTRQTVAKRNGMRYAVEPRPGLDFARNAALGLATTDWIAYFDDGIVPDPGWLTGFREALAAYPDAGGVTGLVLPLALDTPAQVLFERRGAFRRGYLRRRIGPTRPDDPVHPAGCAAFGAGSNMAFRRMLLQELGGFDEGLNTSASFPGGGDLDMLYRLARSGRTFIHEPGCTVFRQHGRTLADLERQCWDRGLGMGIYVGKWLAADRDSRRRFRRLALRWTKDMMRQWRRAITRPQSTPPSLILKELSGGVWGLLGEYGRSRRRIGGMWGAGP